jgi:hypothetical protein
MTRYHSSPPSNPRLQRTRMRAPLSRKPLDDLLEGSVA